MLNSGLYSRISASNACRTETQCSVADPRAETDRDFHDFLNDESLVTLGKTKVEAAMERLSTGECFQLERLGYFCVDPDSATDRLVLNRTVALRDSRPKTHTS